MSKGREYTLQEFWNQYEHLTKQERPTLGYLRKCCRGDVDPRKDKAYTLPSGWEAFKKERDRHWHVREVHPIVFPNEPLNDEPNSFNEWIRTVTRSHKPSSVEQLRLYHIAAQAENRDYDVRVLFKHDGQIELKLIHPKTEARLREPAFLFYMAWALMLMGKSGLINRADMLEQFRHLDVDNYLGDAPVLQDGKQVVEHLRKTTTGTLQQSAFRDFAERCLSCIENAKEKGKLYCTVQCGKNLSDFLGEHLTDPFRQIDEAFASRLRKAGLTETDFEY